MHNISGRQWKVPIKGMANKSAHKIKNRRMAVPACCLHNNCHEMNFIVNPSPAEITPKKVIYSLQSLIKSPLHMFVNHLFFRDVLLFSDEI